ncbi:uncharacterized protein RAG0_13607 [Rhynchosporium agropyri]|uniref:Uncharacterized protein n=1 Tax=Rhynchosporium agropyri TaxID=914238 RepID=A0A1E1LFU5_9HELO|nr:uncharacterized protein RAG0_13607 [Rhynchosporium agropyri]
MGSITELEPSLTIDIVDFEEPRTPTMTALNVAELHDWQSRTKDTESELHTERKRLYQERKRTRRLQNEVNTYHNSLIISKRVSDEAIAQCQSLLHTNALLAQEVQKQKAAVETLETLIQKLCTESKEGSVFTQVPAWQVAGTGHLSTGMEGIVEVD